MLRQEPQPPPLSMWAPLQGTPWPNVGPLPREGRAGGQGCGALAWHSGEAPPRPLLTGKSLPHDVNHDLGNQS